MDSPVKNPKQGIRIIDVAIGYLAEEANDCQGHIKTLKKLRTILSALLDGAEEVLKDEGLDQVDRLYNAALTRASEKVGKHVRVFEFDSRKEDFQDLIGDEEDA